MGLFRWKMHALLDLASPAAVEGHPKLGASWEGFCIENILAWCGERSAWFWATHAQAELDLLVQYRGRRFGFEFKYVDAPGITRSMRIAREDLGLERVFVVYPGVGGSFALDSWVEAVAVKDLQKLLARLSAQGAAGG